LTSSHDLSPLLEYDQLHLSALEPAELLLVHQRRAMRSRRTTQHVGRPKSPARKSSTNLQTDVRDPKNPSISLQNVSQTPHGSRLRAFDLTLNPEGYITRRPTSVRPPEDPFTKVNSNSLDLRRDPQRHLTPLPNPRGTHQQASEPPQRSEDLVTDSDALRVPWNPPTNGRLTA
jgi:hypothetical protein